MFSVQMQQCADAYSGALEVGERVQLSVTILIPSTLHQSWRNVEEQSHMVWNNEVMGEGTLPSSSA